MVVDMGTQRTEICVEGVCECVPQCADNMLCNSGGPDFVLLVATTTAFKGQAKAARGKRGKRGI